MTPTPEPTPTPPLPPDRTIWVLCGFVLFFVVATIVISILLPGNDKIYTLLAPQVGVFSGALLLWLKPRS